MEKLNLLAFTAEPLDHRREPNLRQMHPESINMIKKVVCKIHTSGMGCRWCCEGPSARGSSWLWPEGLCTCTRPPLDLEGTCGPALSMHKEGTPKTETLCHQSALCSRVLREALHGSPIRLQAVITAKTEG